MLYVKLPHWMVAQEVVLERPLAVISATSVVTVEATASACEPEPKAIAENALGVVVTNLLAVAV